jgi:hypothetical protein
MPFTSLISIAADAGRARALLAVSVGVLLAAGAALQVPPTAEAAAPARALAPTSQLSGLASAVPFAARGGGFRTMPRVSRSRPGIRNRPVTRNRNTGRALRGVSRAILQALGIAFLLHLLFGIGAGGSPLGLLLLFGIIALIVVSRRRRHRQRLSYR